MYLKKQKASTLSFIKYIDIIASVPAVLRVETGRLRVKMVKPGRDTQVTLRKYQGWRPHREKTTHRRAVVNTYTTSEGEVGETCFFHPPKNKSCGRIPLLP